MVDADATLRAAERVVGVLQNHGIPAMVIGAVALAAYRYVSFTEDLELGLRRNSLSPTAAASCAERCGY